MITYSVSGSGNLLKKVETLKDARFLQAVVSAAATQLQGALIESEPVSKSGPGRFSLTTGRPMGYYERGRGWWYPLMRKPSGPMGKAYGTIRAKGIIRQSSGVAGYRLAGGGKSEQFMKRWTIRYEDNGLTAVIGNNTTYGHWVMGSDQARLMERLGWTKAGIVAKREWPRIMSAVEASTKKYIAGRG